MAASAGPASGERAGSGTRGPRLAQAFREGVADFYYNSWRLVPANLAWAGLLVVVLVTGAIWPPAWLLIGVLGVPVAGIHRMAARIARGDGGSFSDFLDGMRRFAVPALGAGVVSTMLAIVFTTNVVAGLQLDNPVGWFLSATAFYADIGLAMILVAFWPLLVDPRREALPVRRRLVLALLVVVARPGRMTVLVVGLALLLVLSTLLIAGLPLVGVAFTSLVATRYVLPLADLVELRISGEAPRQATGS